MRIKTRLVFLFTSVAVVVTATLCGMFYAEHKIDEALSLSRKAYVIVHSVSELNRLATEINNSGIPRIHMQWDKKMPSLWKALGEYQGDTETTARLHREVALLDSTFSKLIKTFDNQTPSNISANFSQARIYRLNHLTVLLHSISTLADNIAKKRYEQIQSVQEKRNLFLLACGAVWCVMVIIWTSALWTGIMTPLHRLLRSIKTVGQGDLGHRVKITGNGNEINSLILSFNSMLDRLQELTVSRKRIFDTTEQERTRIGRDLHDGISQMLASIKLQLEVISHNSTDKKAILKVMRDLVRAQKEIQRIVKDLRPVMLDDYGLILTLQWFCDQGGTDINFQLNVYIDEKDIPKKLHTPIFRIVQEATSNAQHHGKADTIQIQINKGENTIDLCVEDNGQGFDTGLKTTGNGLGNMRERVAAEQGDFIVDSSKGCGCCIIASFPANSTCG